jgi:hypothetical protein
MQTTHIRCDRCGKDVAKNNRHLRREMAGWAHCLVDFYSLDFCPECWKQMLAMAQVEEPVDSD